MDKLSSAEKETLNPKTSVPTGKGAALKESVKDKTRYMEVLGVFAKHNFYVNGFTPEELRTTLEDLGPTYVKIGQIMSSRIDLLPEDYCEELTKLRSSVKPLESAVVRNVIEQETGRKIEDIYSEFRDEPLGSASIAQAHYGVLKDGTRVVTKVQRPFIADMMRKDFVMLKKIASWVGSASQEDGGTIVNLGLVIKELEKVTEEELDFRIEAKNTRFFRQNCIEDPEKISCPQIIDDLTTERILTMTYIDGYSISHKERAEAEGIDRIKVGEAIVESYLHQILDVGTFHGDPHQGNIMLSGGVPYWIDFGMIGHISDSSIEAIQSVILALLQKDTEALTDAALNIGEVKGKMDKSRLIDDVEGLIDRYSSGKSLANLDTGALMTDLTEVMGRHHISMPGEYTMLVRSLVTIEGVLNEFCPGLNLFSFLAKKMAARAKENFDLQQQVQSIFESVLASGTRTARLPGAVFDVLHGLSKGRIKIKLELAGGDEVLKTANGIIRNIVLAVFACILFLGSCLMCLSNVQPAISGMPAPAFIGFFLSVALAVYSIGRFTGSDKK